MMENSPSIIVKKGGDRIEEINYFQMTNSTDEEQMEQGTLEEKHERSELDIRKHHQRHLRS
jgi:hypothetical protein